MKPFTLHLGDCLQTLRGMPDHCVDAIVTDPPYHLTTGKAGGQGFMGMAWDGGDIAFRVELWREALRVLKPGGHLLAFSGTRTYHRMVVAIEDAGFEIRDQLGWVYGSGFPKSLDVAKAIDKAAGAERQVVSQGKPVKRMVPGAEQNATGSWIKDTGREYVPAVTAPATEAAAQWAGWGTALKPAWEPICMARKPLAGTVAANVLQHGTGALNIDGCRVGTDVVGWGGGRGGSDDPSQSMGRNYRFGEGEARPVVGRWPANLVHDGSPEVLAAFPHASGAVAPVKGTEASSKTASTFGTYAGCAPSDQRDGGGSAARFFYCAKASRTDRNEGVGGGDTPAVGTGATMREREDADWSARNGNHHPTVKPAALMQWLVRLVTPPGGVVLDPFMGSGSTGKACMREGFRFIGCELGAEYLDIARARIEHAHGQAESARHVAPAAQSDLFEAAAA